MNIVCVICSELLTPSDDTFHTPCGHVFHYPCLLQWLERSTTCPQCRVRTTNQTIHRIYFNFSNNDSIIEDPASLQNKIDNLNFQLKLKDKDLNNLTEDNKILKSQKAGLKGKIHEVENEITSKNSAIHALKDQIKFYKRRCSNAENDKKEIEELKERIEHLRTIQNLLDSSKSKMDNIIPQTSDASKLIIYLGVLKDELDKMREMHKELRNKYRNEQQKFIQVLKKNKFLIQESAKQNELKERCTELEEQLKRCETEKISLQTQLFNVQTDAQKCSPKLKKSNSCIMDPDSTENIPQSKSRDFFSMSNHDMKRQNNSNNNLKIPPTLVKKSKINQLNQKTASGSGMSFDGFGGHAKYDKFPNPISSSHVKKTREDSKTSKSNLDTGNNKKISDLLMLS